MFIGRTNAEAETPILWPPDAKNWLIGKRPWCWERLKKGGEGDDRGWDGWMAALTQWTWVWVNSRSWWWTGRPGVQQSMGLQRLEHDWVTELNWTELKECRRPIEDKEMDSPLETPERNIALLTSYCGPVKLCQTSNLKSCKIINQCYFKPLSLW